jgi:hypothetical protein
MPSNHCYTDGHQVQFYDSKGCRNGIRRWFIECPEYTGGVKTVVDARSEYSSIVSALNDVPPEQRAQVVRVHMRPHQAVALFLEKFLSARDLDHARDRDGYIELGPVKVEGKSLTICVYRRLDSNMSLVLADANGKAVYDYIHRSVRTFAD